MDKNHAVGARKGVQRGQGGSWKSGSPSLLCVCRWGAQAGLAPFSENLLS